MKSLYSGICILCLSLGFLLGFSPIGFAQMAEDAGEAIEIEHVVITATRTEVPIKETAGSITVIDSKTIEEKHLVTVLDVLRGVPGLDILQNGGLGGTTSAFLRGGNSNHTLVLIDGVQVNNPTTGAFNFADLTTENIDRIEILRGPQSTLYGSDAIGGVIHIITKRGKGRPISTVSFEGGSFRTFRETIGFSGSSERIEYSFSSARIDSEGFSKANKSAGNPEKDGYQNTTLSSRIRINLTDQVHLEWTTRFMDSRTDLDGCSVTCPVDDINSIQETRTLVSSTKFTAPITSYWSQDLSLSLNQEELQGIDPDDAFNNYSIDTRGKRLDWRHHFSFGDLNLLTLGYEYESLRAEGSFDKSITNNAGYALNQLRFNHLILNLGGRIDNNNRFENEATYKSEAAYLFESMGSKIRAAYGTGFHGPTLNDLFFPGFGNPNLRPERSRSAEAGIEQQFFKDKLKIAGTYFHTTVDDLIIFVFDPITFISMPENVEESRIKGFELELDVALFKNIVLSGNYTLTNAQNLDTGKEIARRPKHKAGTTLSLRPFADLSLNLDLRYIGKRFDDTANAVTLSAYTLINMAGTYNLNPNVQVFTRVENLFDREYEEIAGYGTAGLSGYGGIKMTF